MKSLILNVSSEHKFSKLQREPKKLSVASGGRMVVKSRRIRTGECGRVGGEGLSHLEYAVSK